MASNGGSGGGGEKQGGTESVRLVCAAIAAAAAKLANAQVALAAAASHQEGCTRTLEVLERAKAARQDIATAQAAAAAAAGDVAAVKIAIADEWTDLSRPIPTPQAPVTPQRSPLMAAAAGNHSAVAYLLLDSGADVNQTEDGWTALMWAAQLGHHAMARLLIDRGARLLRPEERFKADFLGEWKQHTGGAALALPALACAVEGGHLIAATLLDLFNLASATARLIIVRA